MMTKSSVSTVSTPVSGVGAIFPDAPPALQQRLEEGLALVDTRLQEVLTDDDAFIAEASRHIYAAGGKRFRPLLTLLAAETGTGRTPQVVDAAVAVELTHLASLYHDDVMDEATVRRGVPSANRVYDNSTSILVGDLLFGRASELLAGLGADAVLIQAQTFVRLCSGQIRDDRPVPDGVDPVGYYRGVLADKTGSLVATAARFGGMFGGVSEDGLQALMEYGEAVGVAFQLADDLLDVEASEATLGKTPGTDLREGKATLPVIYARSADDGVPGTARLRDLLAGAIADPGALSEALGLLRAHPALARARADTEAEATRAADLLAPLKGAGSDGAVDALRALARSVVTREV